MSEQEKNFKDPSKLEETKHEKDIKSEESSKISLKLVGNTSPSQELDKAKAKAEHFHLYEEQPIQTMEKDKLGFQDSVKVVSHVFINIEPPLTFGIYGEWGTGRTSFLNLLKESLSQHNNFKILDFNAWVFKNEDNLVFPLLRTLQKDLEITESFFMDAKKTALLSRISFQEAMETLYPFEEYARERSNTPAPSYDEEFLIHYDLWIDQVQSLKKHLGRIIKSKLTAQGKDRLAIFIDNLDLCPAEISTNLLEFIYLYLNIPNCINIIAIDPNQHTKNIKSLHQFKLSQAGRYLERIIPYSFTLPILTDFRLRNFILDNIYEIFTSEEDVAKWDSLRRKIDRLLTIYLEKEKENPKKIIKELNIFFVVFKLKAGQAPSIPMALFLIILRNFYPEVFKFILNHTSKGLVDLKALFDPDTEEMTTTGFQIRYGKHLAPYLNDFSLKNLMNSFRFAEEDWPLIEDYLHVVSFLSAN